MRVPPFLALAALWACAHPLDPAQGSMEQVVTTYTDALLVSDASTMQRYAASGIHVSDSAKNPAAAALHAVKICPQGGNAEGTRKLLLVLIGGDLAGLV